MDGPSRTIKLAGVLSRRAQASKGLGKMSSRVQALLQVSAVKKLGMHCCEWPAGKVNAEVQNCLSKPTAIHMTS